MVVATAGDDAVAPRFGDDSRRLDLAGHASLRQAASLVAGKALDGAIHAWHNIQPLRGGIGRMAIKQAVHVGEEHKQGGPQHRGDQRGQAVVVAEAGAQFLHADGVILVDDRDGAVVEQGPQRVADIEILGSVLQVVGHQEELGRMAILRPQHPFIGFDQTALADGCHRLQVGQFLGPGAQPHAAHAGTYGSGTHQHNLPAAVEKFVELLPQGLDSRTIEESVGAGKHAGADLHDQ